MSNALNITVTNFDRDTNKLMYKDAILSIKLEGDTTFRTLGILKGEKKFSIAREWLDFEEGIPKTTIARAIKKQTPTVTGKLAQIQPETVALISGNYIDSATTAGHKRVVLASEVYQPLYCSLLLTSSTQDLKDVQIGLRKCMLTGETLEMLFGADDWSTIDFNAIASPDAEPLVTNFTWPCLNVYSSAADECTISNASKDISLASTTGFAAGQYVYTAENGNIGTIDTVSTNSKITLLANPAASESTVTIKAILPSLIAKDDIGYIDFED